MSITAAEFYKWMIVFGLTDDTTPVGGGDVVGPASATINAIARYNGTTGKRIKNSLVTIDDLGKLTAPGLVAIDSILFPNNDQNVIHVSSTTPTGIPDGSVYNPYPNIGAVMAAGLPADASNPMTIVMSGVITEISNVLLKPYYSIMGSGAFGTQWNIDTFNVTLDPSWDVGFAFGVMSNVLVNGTGNINFDTSTFISGGTKLFFNDSIFFAVDVTVTGDASTIWAMLPGCDIQASLTLTLNNIPSAFLISDIFNGNLVVTSSSAGHDTTVFTQGLLGLPGSTITATSTGTDSCNLTINSSTVQPGSLTGNGANATVYMDVGSYIAATLTGGAQQVTTPVAIGAGGTGLTTLPSNGKILVGNTGNAYELGEIVGANGITASYSDTSHKYEIGIPNASQTEIYVTTGGLNSNTGQATNPFLTIVHADTIAPSGSSVFAAPGSYSEGPFLKRVGVGLYGSSPEDCSFTSSGFLGIDNTQWIAATAPSFAIHDITLIGTLTSYYPSIYIPNSTQIYSNVNFASNSFRGGLVTTLKLKKGCVIQGAEIKDTPTFVMDGGDCYGEFSHTSDDSTSVPTINLIFNNVDFHGHNINITTGGSGVGSYNIYVTNCRNINKIDYFDSFLGVPSTLTIDESSYPAAGVDDHDSGPLTINLVGGNPVVEVTSTSKGLRAGYEYIANNAALVTFTLPTVAKVGDKYRITGKGAGLFKLAQNASQSTVFLDQITTTGTGGSITATQRYQAMEIECLTANTLFSITYGSGAAFTVV